MWTVGLTALNKFLFCSVDGPRFMHAHNRSELHLPSEMPLFIFSSLEKNVIQTFVQLIMFLLLLLF